MNTPADKLDEALAKLPTSIEPTHDLWPGIVTRITPHQTRHWSDNAWSQVSAVAAVVNVEFVADVESGVELRRYQRQRAMIGLLHHADDG